MEAGREGPLLSLWGVKSTLRSAPSCITALGAACPAPPPSAEGLLFRGGHRPGPPGLPPTHSSPQLSNSGTSQPSSQPSSLWLLGLIPGVWAILGRERGLRSYCSVLWGAGLREQVVGEAELCQDPGPGVSIRGPGGLGSGGVLYTSGFLGLARLHRLEKAGLRPILPS